MLRLHDQRFPEAGGIDAQSVTNFLGKHRLSQTEVLVREAVQNSWDARVSEQIRFRVEERYLSPEQTEFVLKDLVGERPAHGRVRDLESYVQDGRLRVLVVADEGTRGLGGPIRADIATQERSDFVDFVRNIGRSEAKGLEGGTYGLGKGVFFQASHVGVCLIYTQARHEGVVQSRFIAMSMGDVDYIVDEKRYTGRNWWGVPTGSTELVDPVLGADAWNIADRLGMPVPGWERTGTSIMILAPQMDPNSRAKDLRDSIREALLKWTWPRLQPDAQAPIRVVIAGLDGQEEEVLASSEPDLSAFRAAYRLADDPNAPEQAIERKWPIISGRQQLGVLAVRIIPSVEEPGSEDMANHIALLRKPRQVVRYLAVPRMPDGSRVQGVFLADESQDELFAQSEPATHDDWVPSQTQGAKGSRNYVRITLDHIKKCIVSLGLELRPPEPDTPSTPGATRLSGMLGDLVAGFSGTGAEKHPPKPSQPRKPSGSAGRPRVTYRGAPELMLEDGHIVCRAPFEVSSSTLSGRFHVETTSAVVTDGGGSEGEPPVGAELPEFLRWEVDDQYFFDPVLELDPAAGLTGFALFRQPRDTEIKVEVLVREAADAG